MDTVGTPFSWFLAQLKPNCHRIASRNLNRQGFETFLPLEETTRRKGSRFVTRLQPLYPGYLFVLLDIRIGSWRAVNGTSGVARLLSQGGGPSPVPPELVEQLKFRCDAEGKLLPPSSFAPGDIVRVTQGPMTDYVAKVETLAADRRIWLLLEFMGRNIRFKVEMSSLQRA